MRKAISITAAITLGAAFSLGAATVPAMASTAEPDSCPIEYGILWHGAVGYHIPASGAYYKDGPGGTMTVSVTKATAIKRSITGTLDVTENFFFGSAKQQISSTLEEQVTITTGHTYSHTITANKYGNMQYGSNGYKANWEETREEPNCTSTTIESGTAVWPASSVGWKYWETSS